LGGSTVFSQEVPDDWTIASCLQRRLGSRWRVENHGVCSMIARQQADRLAHTPIQPGDVVVFYDGVNEVVYPVYNGNARGWMPGEAHGGGPRQLSRIQRRLYPLCFRFHRHSATARLFLARLDGRAPDHVRDESAFDRNLAAAEEGLTEALVQAEAHVRSHGGRFVHFLQPNLFTLAKHSSYEGRILKNELKELPGLDRAFAAAYPRLRRALAHLCEQGVQSHDLSTGLDAREVRQEFYLDFCHVNHAANERIARHIHEHLFASRGDP
jgi:hypothetical protein